MGRDCTARPVVVLGFGVAGVSAVRAMRASGYEGPLAVVTDAGPQPYSPVLTSYYAGGRIERDRCFPWDDLDVPGMVDELITFAHISSVDVEAHEVVLVEGRRIGYSKLLIATGARPIAAAFPQLKAYRPHVLRTMEDAERLRCSLSTGTRKSVLVSGTSMVGLKAVEACLDRNASVTMLGRSSQILRASAHPVVAERFEQLLSERGVALRLSQTVDCADDHGMPEGCDVRFSDGSTEHFDEVILAQGVKPNIEFIDAASVDMQDGIVVDQFMRTSASDVFAAGDVAQTLDLSSGKKRIIGLWQNAVQQGCCAGEAIAAEAMGKTPIRPFPGSIPSNIIHVHDVLFASAGSLALCSGEGEGRRLDICETHDAVSVFAYETRDHVEQLVGFNILAVAESERQQRKLVDEIGVQRRKIINSYL